MQEGEWNISSVERENLEFYIHQNFPSELVEKEWCCRTNKLKEFITSRPNLKWTLKGVHQGEKNDKDKYYGMKICVPSKFICEALILNVMVYGIGAFDR